MKKILRSITVWMLLLVLPLAAAAQGRTCKISVDSVSGKAGQLVTVPVRISENPGFTNFGIALDYDREKMTLVSIQLADEKQEPYLCGSFAAGNIAWDPALDANAEEFPEDTRLGYVVCAQPEAVISEGILFTATFQLAANFSGTAAVMPVVNYLRNNNAVVTIFETVNAQTEAGTVTAETATILLGDVNGDGIVSAAEIVKIIQGYRGKSVDASVMSAVDSNGNGIIDASELIRTVRNYRGG